MTTDGTTVLAPEALPSDLATCHALIRQLLEQLNNSSRKLTQMEHQLQQLLRRLYGRSSEKIDPKQMALFAEMLKQDHMKGREHDPPLGRRFTAFLVLFFVAACLGLYFWLKP